MEGSRFDQVVRQAFAGRSRRAVVGTLLAAAVAPLGRPAATEARKRKQKRRRRKSRGAGRSDPGLRLLEQLADELEQVTDDCDALAAAAVAFQQQHEEALQALLDEAADWTPEQRQERTKRHRGRIVAAVQAIQAQLASCGFRGAAASPICEEGGQSTLPAPGGTTCHGCDCQCICPLSSGECVGQCAACAVGNRDACCWCGTCVDHNCSKQCVNCCKLPSA